MVNRLPRANELETPSINSYTHRYTTRTEERSENKRMEQKISDVDKHLCICIRRKITLMDPPIL